MLPAGFLALALGSALLPAPAARAADTQCRPVAASPGTRLAVDIRDLGQGPGPLDVPLDVTLDVTLERPGDPQGSSPLGWSEPAGPGGQTQVGWEFAYDWEIVPGMWVMRVRREGALVAEACFDVTRAARAQDPATAQKGRAGEQGGGRTSEGAPPPAKSPDLPPGRDHSPAQATGRADGRKGTGQAAPPSGPERPRPQARAEAQGRQPAGPLAGVAPTATLHVLVSGVYSEEARARWMAVFLSKSGVKACVRQEQGKARTLWAVVTGWADTPGEARALRDRQSATAGETVIRSMAASDLARGLSCP